ncbi:hypothetical protein Val02_62580 [Virgisporangium aliadipatigenens]|uniref:LysM domain-containing protein n=1 Tax=Virgisporangium aliadipatigenens TaxID=741659 RepID=A0A8J3YRW7_9ACTN|nr:BTAD domain-containing putative transcriptional regulator [Virgisporangium aliadipatigenens]GIJ49372.1 hypothetical protein Val02_62580 [Virgisporangium aliadipatigenens]
MLTTLASLARRIAGLAALALLLIGVPYALLTYLPSPLPHEVPSWTDVADALTTHLTDETLGLALVAALWATWLSFAWSVAAELLAVLAGVRLPQPRAFTPTRGLAAVLVAAITGGILATAAQAHPPAGAAFAATPTPTASAVSTSPATPTATDAGTVTVDAVATTSTATTPTSVTLAATSPAMMDVHAGAARSVAGGEVTLVANGHRYSYTVRPGDSLSDIAKTWLGDANRWPEIFALNRGVHFTNPGGTLRNPDIIRPGWTLDLPDDATPPAGLTPAAPTPPAGSDPPSSAPEAAPPPDPEPVTPSTSTAPSVDSTPPSVPVDDGVIADPPPQDSTQPQTPSQNSDDDRAPSTSAPVPGVHLGSGSWVDVGLVAALLAAVALVWAHRRRHQRRRDLSADLIVDDPMPPVVTHLRRGLRTGERVTAASVRDLHAYRTFLDDLRTAGTDDAPAADDDTVDFPAPLVADTPTSDTSDPDATAEEDGAEGDGEGDGDGDDLWDLLADPPPPVTPALTNPIVDMWPPAGIGLTGPAAEAAARGFLVAALAAGGVDEPHSRGYVVIPAATLATLLGADAVLLPDSDRLTVTADLNHGLTILEQEALTRSRILYDNEVDNLTALRETDPMAPYMPPTVLITDVNADHERVRIAALLSASPHVDIHGVLLGDWPHGNTVIVAEDGTLTPATSDAARHGAHLADTGRLTILAPDEATDLLRVLIESHNGEPIGTAYDRPDSPAETAPSADEAMIAAADAEATESANPAETTDDAVVPDQSDVRDGRDDLPARTTGPAQGLEPLGSGEERREKDDGERPANLGAANGCTPVTVHLLGRPHIVDAPQDERLRPQAVELLAYLAARGGTASQDDILEDLIPEMPARSAPQRLHTIVSNLRRIATLIGGTQDYIEFTRTKQYRLNRDAFRIDLWQMQDAIRDALTATDSNGRIAALRRAVGLYTGPFADITRRYDWAETYREAARRQAVDAVLTLAETLTVTGETMEALAVLDAATAHHPHAEQIARAIMRIHAGRSDADAIRATRTALRRRLDDIDAEAGDETLALADELLAGLPQQQRSPHAAGGPT